MPRASADERLQRLLAIVPWVAGHDGPAVSEVCSRFGITEAELMAELDLLWVCGLYPYTPDVLIEVDIADGRVWIRYADFFRRPLRLTAAEGLALLSAGSALLAVPGSDPDGPLARALAKLSTVLGVEADETVDVELGPAAPEVLATIQDGVAGRRAIEIDYYSFGRDEHTVRRVDPWEVFNAAGQWYLDGWCQRAEGRRLFRVDRILQVALLDEPITRPRTIAALDGGPPPLYSPRPDDPVITLDLSRAAGWVAEKYPVEASEPRPDGGLRVRIRVSELAWLERLLLRLGPDAAVVDGSRAGRKGSPAMARVRATAASRILARYRMRGTTERDPGSTLAAP
jgi:proteasome accessory factor C